MTFRQPRLSISNSLLPTAVDWAVMRAMREWHNGVEAADASASSSEGRVTEELSPFWIPTQVVDFLAKALLRERQSSHMPFRTPVMDGTRMTTMSGTKQVESVYFAKGKRTVSVFGFSFVNASSTPICSAVDSCTCVSYELPISESGDLIGLLMGKMSFAAPSRLSSVTASCGGNHSLGKGCFPLKFGSPYWIEGEGLERRWRGVTISPNATPLYVGRSSRWLINAEQTNDASRFDSLSCTPFRRHQCLTEDGVHYVSLDFSARLAEAFLEMKRDPEKTHSTPTKLYEPNTTRRKCHEHHCFYERQQQMTDSPSNLWIDAGVIERSGWSLQDAAVGVELPPHQLIGVERNAVSGVNSATVKAKPIVVVNAEFVCERDSLLDLITYRPECIGLQRNQFLGSRATTQLALLAHTMNYTSPTWIQTTVAERAGLCVKKGRAATGVEVKIKGIYQNETLTVVLINTDELDLTQERIAELRNGSV
ncbi:hypothetical protein TcG_02245 [Trypanosoma cruzi]|uniref:Trypanosoma Tc-38 (p38) protein domain-containing protein n=1 Tax=Trypanosoma cruzi TaxID=5693 RepID=A0A2V2VMU8_TRYCR|nr:hypothetical protein BCY84_00969 [Trypanosoma cruzi cruzi]PWU96538.1 hypothetical protein C4B63_18g21 [Trypanosoma cruzi]RNF22145.1 hypothetical protein TcG_02245 [Trypanosoma cruzi]